MSLRIKVAVALTALAALSSTAAASISYVVTTSRLNNEVDSTLQSYVHRFADPDGRLARALCSTTGPPNGPPRGADQDDYEAMFQGLPGVTVQCVQSSGAVINSVGPPGVPVPSSDTRRPWSGGAVRTEHLGGTGYRVITMASPTGDVIRISRSLAETEQVSDSVRNRLIGVGGGIAVLAGAIGLIIASRTTRPIMRLTRAAEDIAQTGDLGVDLPEPGSDEIGRLTSAFAGMIAALNRSREQQQRLVQDAGHELRTPLTSLRTNIDTLRRYPILEDGSRTRILVDLDSELRELSRVVDELIALAEDRFDQEPPQQVDLGTVVRSVVERTARRTSRDITVRGTSPDVVAKPYQITRVVGNLVENAVKFSPETTRIEVTIEDHSVEVRDHGPGIADEDLPLVFDRFYRAVAARSMAGSGLGLAIVAQIMQRMGGSASAANHLDGGAVFTLRFPSVAETSTKAIR